MNSHVVRCHLIPFMDRKLHNTLENLQPARLQRFIVLVVPLPLVIIIVGLTYPSNSFWCQQFIDMPTAVLIASPARRAHPM